MRPRDQRSEEGVQIGDRGDDEHDGDGFRREAVAQQGGADEAADSDVDQRRWHA